MGMTALRIVRAGADDLLVQVDPANALTLRYRPARAPDSWEHVDADLSELSLSYFDLEALVVVDAPVAVPNPWDGKPAPEPETREPVKRRRVATVDDKPKPKLRKPAKSVAA